MKKLILLGVAISFIALFVLPSVLALECRNLFSPACLNDDFDLKDTEMWKELGRFGAFFSINYWFFNILKKFYGGLI